MKAIHSSDAVRGSTSPPSIDCQKAANLCGSAQSITAAKKRATAT